MSIIAITITRIARRRRCAPEIADLDLNSTFQEFQPADAKTLSGLSVSRKEELRT
jgi:hypothetical protein